jgi:DNA-binding response OmpR family regulator
VARRSAAHVADARPTPPTSDRDRDAKTGYYRGVAEAQHKLVLVVDDDPSICDLIGKALKAKGYEVEQAGDGLAASKRLGDLDRRPDLLICDVMMPTIDGFSLARLVKARDELRDMPIIFLTARTHFNDVLEGINLGARHYVQKPFKLNDLLDKVEKALHKKAAR